MDSISKATVPTPKSATEPQLPIHVPALYTPAFPTAMGWESRGRKVRTRVPGKSYQ